MVKDLLRPKVGRSLGGEINIKCLTDTDRIKGSYMCMVQGSVTINVEFRIERF